MIPQRDTFGAVTRRYLPLSGKRITFDSEIIETLYTILRQIIIDHLEGFGRMAYSNLDDVDYLVEDNVMDEFCLSPEMEGTLVVQAGNKMQMLGTILVTGEEPNNRE